MTGFEFANNKGITKISKKLEKLMNRQIVKVWYNDFEKCYKLMLEGSWEHLTANKKDTITMYDIINYRTSTNRLFADRITILDYEFQTNKYEVIELSELI